MAKIMIVEDQLILRESMEHVINTQDDMKVVGGTDDAAEAPQLCRELKPDLVLMDVVTKNNSSGINYAALIRDEFPNTKVVIMTAWPDITFAEEAKKAGAHSFIDKNIGNEHLFHVIRQTLKGYSIYSGHAERQQFALKFTDKEIAIIQMVCQGMTRNEMAKKMSLSDSMIGNHITSILNKAGFDSISKFAIYAVSEGLIVPQQA